MFYRFFFLFLSLIVEALFKIMETVRLPVEEYNMLIAQNKALQQNELLEKINQVLDLMYQNRYGFYLGDYTEDLTEYSINNHFVESTGAWDAL